jgi:VWFA-related protein
MRVRPTARLVVGALVVLASVRGAVWLSAQERAPGAIRVRITLVPINVVVTDLNDRPVNDLKASDFTVLEDGVRQQISHFEFQALAAMATDPAKPATALLRKVPTAELTPETRRTFLIVLGRGRLQQPSKGIDGLLQFVRTELLPQDVVAVFAYNRATDFTTDHEKIAQVLERFKKYHEGIEAKMALRFSGLAAIYGSQEIPKGLQSEIANIFEVPGAIGAREVPPGSVTGEQQMKSDSRVVSDTLQRAAIAEATGGALNPLDMLRADALTDLPFDDFVSSNSQTMQDVQNLYTAVEYLRYVEGEKHLLFFTENGLFLPRLEHDESLAAMANDARVTIDTFQTGGVAPPPDIAVPGAAAPSGGGAAGAGGGGGVGGGGGRGAAGGGGGGGGRGGAGGGGGGGGRGGGGGQQGGAPPGGGQGGGRNGSASQMFALTSLRNISRLTGGRASIHASVPEALARLDDQTRSGYLLGYYPKNGDWNGKYRRVVVRVNRPDLKLSYRHGYYARESVQPFDRKTFLSYSRISAAASYALEVKDIGVKAAVKAVPAASGGGQEAQVDLVIQVSKLPFAGQDGRHKAALQITTFYGDARGRSLGDLWQTLGLNLRDDTWQKALKDGLPFSTRVPLQAAGQTFKIVVYSYDADKVGSVTARLK